MARNNVYPPRRRFDIGPLEDIAISDAAQQKPLNQPYILDLVTKNRLFFQTIPLELNYNPESSWVAIAAAGRNNPTYHYTGSEDTLSFMITWYAATEGRADVIRKCKWLESLSKNDGYDNQPHSVQCIFGDLFKEAKWIVFSAPYKLAMFNRQIGMLPQLATQEITLKRITVTNRTRRDILRSTT